MDSHGTIASPGYVHHFFFNIFYLFLKTRFPLGFPLKFKMKIEGIVADQFSGNIVFTGHQEIIHQIVIANGI